MSRIRVVLIICAACLFGLSATACAAGPPVYSEHQERSYYLESQGQKHPIKTVADWETRRAQVVAHMESVMGPLPRPAKPIPLDVQTQETVELDGGIVRKHITYHTDRPNQRLAAYL